MDLDEARHRDGVMRAFFEGKTWDRNPEFMLKRDMVRRSAELLPDLPYFVDDEWEVVMGATNSGRGDLLFTNGEGEFAVVEVKFIDLDRSGPTPSSKRTKGRKDVKEQAWKYAHALRSLRPEARVCGYYFTNETPRPEPV